MRVLVCGSRTFSEKAAVYAMLDGIRMGIGDDPDMIVAMCVIAVCDGGGAGRHRTASTAARVAVPSTTKGCDDD